MRAYEFINESSKHLMEVTVETVFSEKYWPQYRIKVINGVLKDRLPNIDVTNINPKDISSDQDTTFRNIAQQLIDTDPTPNGAYVNAIFKWYAQDQNFRIADRDQDQIKLLIIKYHTLKTANKLPAEAKDIMRLTKTDVSKIVSEIERTDKVAAARTSNAERKVAGQRDWGDVGEILIDSGNFAVIVPHNVKQARNACQFPENSIYGKDVAAGKGKTKWCTLGSKQFAEYSEQGPLYNIIVYPSDPNKMRAFQLHYESDQFMDENDDPVDEKDIKFLSKFPEYKNFLNMLIKKHYGKLFDGNS